MDEVNNKKQSELICSGCGVKIQSEKEHQIGYTPQELMLSGADAKKIICKRCHRIKHYNDVQEVSLTEADYDVIIKDINKDKQALIVLVIDLFDFEGSWPTNIVSDLAKKDVVLAINKSDLFPQSVRPNKVLSWVEQTSKQRGLTAKSVFFVSALKAHGLNELASYLINNTLQKNIYFIGATSTGKSTLINRIIPILFKEAGQQLEDNIPEITTSSHSGTTLGNLNISINKERQVIDTPGIIKKIRLTDQVCGKCLKIIMPRNKLKPKVYQLNSGQSLFIGGLARIDFVEGNRQSMVVYAANALNIHRTKLENADKIWEQHKQELLVPTCSECPQLLELEQTKSYTIKQESDIAIAGLGWIKLQAKNAEIIVHAPKTADISIRKSLF